MVTDQDLAVIAVLFDLAVFVTVLSFILLVMAVFADHILTPIMRRWPRRVRRFNRSL